MKKLLTFLALVSLTVAAAAQTATVLSPVKGVSVNAGFDSKLIEQGAVTGTNISLPVLVLMYIALT